MYIIKKMTDFNQVLDKIKQSNIEFSSSNKYDEIIESYKMIIVKIILSCELTLFNICNENKLKKNLRENSVYDHINIFLQKILLDITEDNITSDITNSIREISKISDDNNDVIYDKIFFLINNFYLNFERNKIPNKNREDYKKYFVKNIILFLKNNIMEIIEVLKDNEYSWDGIYSLGIIEEDDVYEYNENLDTIEENDSFD